MVPHRDLVSNQSAHGRNPSTPAIIPVIWEDNSGDSYRNAVMVIHNHTTYLHISQWWSAIVDDSSALLN